MAWETLIAAVEAVITDNDNNEITGEVLRNILTQNIIPQLGDGEYIGLAELNTNPQTPERKVIYLANEVGNYQHFSNISITESGIYLFSYDLINSVWEKTDLLKTYTKKEIDSKVDGNFTGQFVAGSYGNQNGNLYLSIRAEFDSYDEAEVNVVTNGTPYLVHYREENSVYTLQNSVEIINGKADISGFDVQVNDWFGTLIIGGTTGGVQFISGGNYTKYVGGNSSIPATITESNLNTSSFTFSLKLVKNSTVHEKIKQNNQDYYTSEVIDNKLQGFYKGQFVAGTTFGNQQGSLYLSLRADAINYAKVEIETNATGVIHFAQYRESGGVFTLINSAIFSNNVADVSGFTFLEGDYLGTLIVGGSGGVKFVSGTGSTRYIAGNSSLPSTINEGDLLNATFEFSLRLKVISEIEPLIDEKITSNNQNYYNKNQIDNLSNYKKVGNIVYTNFRNSNLPANWVNAGFTSNIDGLQSPVSGDINTIIEYDQHSNLDSFVTLFKFDMVAPSEVLLTNYHKKLSTLGGHVVGFDLVNGVIKLYEQEVKGTMPTNVLKQESIPFTIKNAETIVRYERNADQEKITLVNAENSFSFEYDGTTSVDSTGQGYDKFGLVFLSGDIVVKEANYSSQLPAEPDVLIIGDSIVNGDTIRSLVGGGSSNRWAGIVSINTLTAITSLGGNTVLDIARDLNFYLGLFKPKKCIYGAGINTSNFSQYTTNVDAFITACNNAGVEPILQTLHPRADRVQYCEDVSNWVKEKGVRYIDFRKVLTVDGLGVTNNSSLFLGDNLHPNVAGHLAMSKEVILTLEF